MTEAGRDNTTQSCYVISAPLFRRKGRSVTLAEAPPSPKPAPVYRPARVAQQLALAHHLQRAIDRGVIADRATLARKLDLTGARITQLLDLTLLAPDVQDAVLTLEAVDGAEPMTERALRAVAHAGTWAEQRTRYLAEFSGILNGKPLTISDGRR